MDFRGNLTPRAAIALTVATLMVGTLTVACQQIPALVTLTKNGDPGDPAKSSTREGLRLGVLLPATGEFATTGQSMLQTLSLMVDTVNSCGGVNDAAINLVAEDEQTHSTAAAVTQLIKEDRADAIVGAFSSTVSLAALPVAVANQVPMISPGSTSPVFTAQAKQGKFKGFWGRTIPSDTSQATALAQLAIGKGFRKVSTVVVNTSEGIAFEKAFVTAFEKLGGKVLDKSKPARHNPKGSVYDIDDEAVNTFRPNGVKPDAVIALLDLETGSALFKSAYDQDLSDGVQIMLADTDRDASFPESAGKTIDEKYILAGAIGTSPGAAGPGLEKLKRLWTDKGEGELSRFAPQTWDAAAVLILAAQAAKTNSGKAIKDKLREVANSPGREVNDVCEGLKLLRQGQKINYQGASSKVDLNENGDILGSYEVWLINSEGQVQTIDQVKLE
jgi:neutral amino acid transport system substrate-binding protein